MRSRLEGRFARYLDSLQADWSYEPRAYGGPMGDYLPDFEVGLEHRPPTFVEVKPSLYDFTVVERAMERISVIWDSEPSATLVVAFSDSPDMLVAYGNRGRWDVTSDHDWRTAADSPAPGGAAAWER